VTINDPPRGALDVENSLVERDARVYMRQAGSTPCLSGIRAAKGVWIEDASGRRFMDFHGNSSHHLGYGHPRLIAAVKAQLDSLPFTPRRFTNAPAIELAEHLSDRWPGRPGKVLLATGGSDAIEIALKIARGATGRHKTISFYNSYHGSGFGALSLGWRARDRARIGPLLSDPIHVRPFYRQLGETGAPTDDETWARASLAEIKAVFDSEEIAALFAEPVRSVPHIPPAWFWPEVRALCSTKRGDKDAGRRLALGLFTRGIFLNPMGTKLYLSLAHDEAVCDAFLDRFDDALADVR
jgi:4-aminobutyrate aminotransferase